MTIETKEALAALKKMGFKKISTNSFFDYAISNGIYTIAFTDETGVGTYFCLNDESKPVTFDYIGKSMMTGCTGKIKQKKIEKDSIEEVIAYILWDADCATYGHAPCKI